MVEQPRNARGTGLSWISNGDVWLGSVTCAALAALVALIFRPDDVRLAGLAAGTAFAALFVVGTLTAGRKRKLFLTLAKRALFLMLSSASGAAALTLAVTKQSVVQSDRGHNRSLNVDPNAQIAEAQKFASLLKSQISSCEMTVMSCAKKLDTIMTASAVEQARMQQENGELAAKLAIEIERTLKDQPETEPDTASDDDANSNEDTDDSIPDASSPSNGGYMGQEVIIPPDKVAVLQRTETGRSFLADLPIVGRILGGLFRGKTKTTTRRVVQMIAEEGRIPSKADLTTLFANAADLEGLRAEMDNLINRAREKDVLSDEIAQGIRAEMDKIAEDLRQQLPSDVIAAVAVLRSKLVERGTCSIGDTAPDFIRFPSAIAKRQAIARVQGKAVKDCLQKYPPAI